MGEKLPSPISDSSPNLLGWMVRGEFVGMDAVIVVGDGALDVPFFMNFLVELVILSNNRGMIFQIDLKCYFLRSLVC